MSPAVNQAVTYLGKSGIGFLLCVLLASIAYLAGSASFTAAFLLLSVPFGLVFSFRVLRDIQRRGLWSVRNRLLFVYGLIGILPLFLVVVLLALGAWAFTNELAVYLVTSALQRHVKTIDGAIDVMRQLPPDRRMLAAPEILRSFRGTLPGLCLYVKTDQGSARFPANSPDLPVAPGWKNVNGLLVYKQRFYAWSHFSGGGEEYVAIAPLTNQQVENLVPNLGAISLFEDSKDADQNGAPTVAGTMAQGQVPKRTGEDPDYKFDISQNSDGGGKTQSQLPPAAFRFDIPVFFPTTLPHYHLNHPNKSYNGYLSFYSRPSAVLGKFFSGTELLRGVLFDVVIGVAILFLLVELIATFIGARLAKRLTGSIHELYNGTLQVIHGDFSHRIPVRADDQLGALTNSFNQMTGNLQRLLAVEKEKERLQTELEIAREVQAQLYPKEAPPLCGLKLSVHCDPARMVSGDYYDYQELSGHQLAFAIGDVAGKGISAALLMATLHASLRAQLGQHQPLRDTGCENQQIDVANLVSVLNRQLYAHTSPEKYATFFFALFDGPSRTLTYTNAGHLSPMLFRGEKVSMLDSNGMVVGAFPFAKYNESCLTLEDGDLLVCYTDGITEPENAYGEMFGEERLIELVQKNKHKEDGEIVHTVLSAVRSWTGSPELFDDMTLLLAREVKNA